MRAKRQTIQSELALQPVAKGEARSAGDRGTRGRGPIFSAQRMKRSGSLGCGISLPNQADTMPLHHLRQLRVVHQHVRFDGFELSGAAIEHGSTDSIRSRG